jgi:hypothetical protein
MDSALLLVLIVIIALVVLRSLTPTPYERPVVVVMTPQAPDQPFGCLPLILLIGLILLLLAANGITLTP